MLNEPTQLLSLPELAEALKLPLYWLKDEADAGRLPHFKIGHRYRFNLAAVKAALLARATQAGGEGAANV